jgi:exosortase A
MTTEQAEIPAADALAQTSRQAWPFGLYAVLAPLAALVGVNWPTTASLCDKWWGSGEYTHAFLIFPISGFLIWRERARVAAIAPAARLAGIVPIAALALAWLSAYLSDVQIVQWLCWLFAIPVLVWTVLGPRVAAGIAFPLAYLLMAVPLWELVTPLLQYMTVVVDATALRLSGIPVLVEQHFITTPNGKFSIEEFCGGLRYFLAASAIGLLFVYMNLDRLRLQVLFMSVIVLFSLALNWLRVYIIMMAGYLTDMQHYLITVDHHTFGWVLFAIGFGLLLFVATRLAPPLASEPVTAPVALPELPERDARLVAIASLLATLLIAAPYSADRVLRSSAPAPLPERIVMVSESSRWSGPFDAQMDIGSSYRNADLETRAEYAAGDDRVVMHLALYARQRQDAELVHYLNKAYDDERWRAVRSRDREVAGADGLRVREIVLASRGSDPGRWLLWHWYYTGGAFTSDPYMAKLLQIRGILTGREAAAAVVAAAPIGDATDDARATLASFTAAMLPALDERLGEIAGD